LNESRTEAEARFEARRRRAGQILAPLAFVGMLALPMSGLTPQGHGLAAITAMTVILWITEAIPLAAAAVLAPSLAVVLGVTDATTAFAPLANPLIFLFMGGFMLALGLAEQGLDRRAALWLLGRRWISGSPARASAAIAVATYLISMWISNTATAAMMIPVALGLSRTIREAAPEVDRPRFDRHAEGMLLGLCYAASLGGIATPVGTAPNVIALGLVESQLDLRIDFFQWMSFALPTSAVTLVVVLLYGAWRFPSPSAARARCRAPKPRCANSSTATKRPRRVPQPNNSTSRYDDDHQDRASRDAGHLRLRAQRPQTRGRVREGRPHHHPRAGPTHQAHSQAL
jgi:sodium-dependent dicarboxylate transporter 2/3/5